MYQHSDHGQNDKRTFLLEPFFCCSLLVQHWPVLVYHVALEVAGCSASIITLATFVWLFSSVLAHMGSQGSTLCARIIAFFATEGLVP